MRFDDRLLTVLNQPAEDRHDAAVRWRQLVDLVARAGSNSGNPIVADALAAIRDEARRVEEPLRAAAARAVAALPLPLALLEYFAADSLSVSAPVLAAATLNSSQWSALHSVADDETRRFIETLRPQLRAEPHVQSSPEPRPEPAQEPHVEPAPEPVGETIRAEPVTPQGQTPATYTPPSLHEVVERIERRRRLRTGQQTPAGQDIAAQQESPGLFRWECGPGGEIAWVEGVPRGPLVGRSIARVQDSDGDRVDQELVRAFGMRAPFRDASLTLTGGGPVSGEWKISGVPAFEPADGRFAGYRGVALREVPAAAVPAPAADVPDVLADPDSVRELVHEIKTPLNAIIGFAEIIEGQYLGPADRGYRDRAAEIVGQARLLLTAIDDLDFAAKVHSAGTARERVDLGALVEREADELRSIAARKGAELEVSRPRQETAAAVQPELADRLLFRLVGALAEKAERGERLHLSVDHVNGNVRISISRPAVLASLSHSDLFDARRDADAAGGFSLRLVRGLARIAGGDLIGNRDHFALTFPRG